MIVISQRQPVEFSPNFPKWIDDDQPTTARHNGGSSPKTCIFPGVWTTGCQFSNWRAVGGRARKTPNLSSFCHSAPFRVVARCQGTSLRRVTRHARRVRRARQRTEFSAPPAEFSRFLPLSQSANPATGGRSLLSRGLRKNRRSRRSFSRAYTQSSQPALSSA
jgi:hypothetical protein